MNAGNIHEFWNDQQSLGERTGYHDMLSNEFDVQPTRLHIRDGAQVWKSGCGDGVTAIALATEYDVSIDGFGFAELRAFEGMVLLNRGGD